MNPFLVVPQRPFFGLKFTADSLLFEEFPFEHGRQCELEALLLPEDLVKVVVVAHARVVDSSVTDLGELLRQEAVCRSDNLVEIRRNLQRQRSKKASQNTTLRV